MRWPVPATAWSGGTPISDPRRHAARPAVRLLLAVAATACASAPPSGVQSPGLELVGLLELPAEVILDGVPLGGLSALAWDDHEGLYHALADDPGEHGPPRLYRLRLSFDDPDPAVEVLSWVPLRDVDGKPYGAGMADPEGLAYLPDGSLLVASEGLPAESVAPFLRRFTADGRQLSEIELPQRYLPGLDGGRGVRASLGFESLAVTPDGRRVYLATEGPLAQDGPAADLGVAGLARLLLLSWPEALALREYAYEVEPLRLTPRPPEGFRIGGLVELLALGPGRLLALERQFAVGAGFSLRLYAVGLSGATDISQFDSLAAVQPLETVCKELVLDFGDLGLELGNLEGLSRGPILADGRQTIVVVEDDNFTAGPAARFLLLAPPRHVPAAASSWLALAQRCW